jgi:hypothetical protein
MGAGGDPVGGIVGTPIRTVRPGEPDLGTSYVDVVERILELLTSLKDTELALAVDTTGVGRPVADMLKSRLGKWLADSQSPRPRLSSAWITVTGGDSVTKAEGGGIRVPKRDLASAPLVLMQNAQLKILRIWRSQTRSEKSSSTSR